MFIKPFIKRGAGVTSKAKPALPGARRNRFPHIDGAGKHIIAIDFSQVLISLKVSCIIYGIDASALELFRGQGVYWAF